MAPPYKPTPSVQAKPGVPKQYQGAGYYTPHGVNHSNPIDVAKAPHFDPNAPPADVGRGADLGGKKATFWDLPVLKRQQMLRAAGYDVSLDGQSGPQTSTASKAYVRGIPASYWNLAWKNNHQPAAPPAAPPHDPVAAAPVAAAAPAPAPRQTTAAPVRNPLEGLLNQILGGMTAKAQSPQDLIKQAGLLATAQIAPYKAELERQQQQALADAQKRAEFQGNLGQAMADLAKSQGPAVADAYHAAGDDQAAFAKGFSTDLAASAEAEAAKTNEFLKSIGAPDAQMIDPGAGKAAGDLLYGLGGYIPGNALAREGAAYASAADLLPQTAIAEGQRLATGELNTGRDAKAKLGQQLVDLQLQRPKLVSDAMAQLQDAALKNRAQAQNEALLPLMLAKDFEGFAGTNPLTGLPTSTQRSIELQVGNEKIKLAQLDLSTRKTLAALTGVDPSTGTPTPETQRLLLAEWKAKNPAAKGGFTMKQISDLRGKAGAIAHDAFFGVAGDDKHDGLPPLTYNDALREIINAGVPLTVAQQALNSYWTKPGFGRTWEEKGDGYEFTGWVKSNGGRPRTPMKISVRRKR